MGKRGTKEPDPQGKPWVNLRSYNGVTCITQDTSKVVTVWRDDGDGGISAEPSIEGTPTAPQFLEFVEGDKVEALWKGDNVKKRVGDKNWYEAIVKTDNGDGTHMIKYCLDGIVEYRKSKRDIRVISKGSAPTRKQAFPSGFWDKRPDQQLAMMESSRGKPQYKPTQWIKTLRDLDQEAGERFQIKRSGDYSSGERARIWSAFSA